MPWNLVSWVSSSARAPVQDWPRPSRIDPRSARLRSLMPSFFDGGAMLVSGIGNPLVNVEQVAAGALHAIQLRLGSVSRDGGLVGDDVAQGGMDVLRHACLVAAYI